MSTLIGIEVILDKITLSYLYQLMALHSPISSADTSNLGTTAEKYSLPAGTEGRYVRITVNGNTENQWASVTEVAVNGLEQASSGPIILKKQTAPGSNTWIPYKSLGGNFKGNPVVAINSDNTLQVFAVSATNGELNCTRNRQLQQAIHGYHISHLVGISKVIHL